MGVKKGGGNENIYKGKAIKVRFEKDGPPSPNYYHPSLRQSEVKNKGG